MVFLSFFGSIFACLLVINVIPYTQSILDIGHYLILRKESTFLPEVILFLHLVIGMFLLPYDALNRGIYLSSIMMWLRASTMWITILPSLGRYKPIEYYGVFGGSNDFLPFSNHSSFSCIITIQLLHTYTSFSVIGILGVLTSLYLFYLLIAMRRHYTIDIIMAVCLSKLIDWSFA